MDVKSIEPIGEAGKAKMYYQYTAIVDCTRLRILRAYPRNDNDHGLAIHLIDYVLFKRDCPDFPGPTQMSMGKRLWDCRTDR